MSASLPTTQGMKQAQQAASLLRKLRGESLTTVLRVHDESRPGTAGHAEQDVAIPSEAVDHLLAVLNHIANGEQITVLPIHKELTTQEAAGLLGVSRPYLIGLLETGLIPFHKVGSHRRVRAADLLEYRAADREARRKIADKLTSEAEALGLDY
jgi:excisionase family DNA binding protein